MGLKSSRAGRPKRSYFTRFSQYIAMQAGRPVTFVAAAGLIGIWGATGPFVGFGDTWQLVINTSTTIITFLMVFVIQNSQNRDTAALHIKLDEIIARTEGTRRVLLDLEELDDDALEDIRAEYEELARQERENGGDDIREKGVSAAQSRKRTRGASQRTPKPRRPTGAPAAGG